MKELVEKREVETFGGLKVTKFGMKVNAKAFRTVIKNLYSRIIPSACRELGSNAFDSHIKAGKSDVPFEVRLPTKFDPTFSVRDFGVGMSIADVEGVYAVLFESTKDQSNEEVGKFGLGAKIPFAYGDIFGLTCWQNGRKIIYSMILDADCEPSAVLLSDEPSDEPTGVEVSFPVAEKDWDAFVQGAIRSFAAFPVIPDISNAYIKNAIQKLHDSGRKVSQGVLYDARAFNEIYGASDRIWVRQGCVVYPVRAESHTPDMKSVNEVLANLGKILVVDVEIGEVEITPNREEIIYDDRTVQNISAKMKGGAAALTADNMQLIARATLHSRWNIIDLYQARIKRFNPNVMVRDIGNPYPHLKVFGRPVCIWRETAKDRLKQYFKMAKRNHDLAVYGMDITGVSDRWEETGATEEETIARQKINIYERDGYAVAISLVQDHVRQHKNHDRHYDRFESSPVDIVILGKMSRSDRDIGNAIINKYKEAGEKSPRAKSQKAIILRNATEKDIQMIWHLLARPKHKPNVIRLEESDVPRIQVEAIKTVVTYRAGSARGVEVRLLKEEKNPIVMIACEKGEKTLFGEVIDFNSQAETRLRDMMRRADDGRGNATIILVPPSKMEMTKEAFDGNLITAEEVMIAAYETIDPNDYDLCQFYARWRMGLEKEVVAYRGIKTVVSDRNWLHSAANNISSTDILGISRTRLSKQARENLHKLSDLSSKIVGLRQFFENQSRHYDYHRTGFFMRPEDIVGSPRQVAWLKKNNLWKRIKKVDQRIINADWRKSKFAKTMMSFRTHLHRRSKILALYLECGNTPYFSKTLGGYSYEDCVRDDISAALEKTRFH